jgi:hypothetical protein
VVARHRTVDVTLLLVAAVLLAVLAYQVVRRVLFPWDLLMWSESPFMTNMIKLAHGQGPYSDPAEANSFVYSPGLEYLAYALLRPLNLHLDVRACRVVTVMSGALAAVAVASVGARLLTMLGAHRRRRLMFAGFAGATATLVIGKNFTADVCHPDNLVMAHASLSLLLAMRALASGRLAPALCAVGFASIGVLAKQPAAGAGVGVCVGLLLAEPAFRRPRAMVALVAVALAVSGASVALLLVPAHSRFWALTVPASHPIEVWKIQVLIREDIIAVPHRLLLFVLTPYAFVWLRLRPEPLVARLPLLWLSLGVAGVLPILSAYFKQLGTWNNLGILDLWAAALVVPVLWHHAMTLLDQGPASGAALPVALLGLLLLTLPPTRIPPSRAHWDYGHQLDRKVKEAKARGENVLLAHGTMPLLRAGLLEVPRDRANSAWEMVIGGLSDGLAIRARLAQAHYDRIIGNGTLDWYGPMRAIINKHYRVVETIPAAGALPGARGTEGLDHHYGYQPGGVLLNTPIQVMTPAAP